MADTDASVEQLHHVLEPDSIAIVGTSADTAKRSHTAMKRLLNSEYDRQVYPVNLSYEGEILGWTVSPSVSESPG